MFVLLPDSPCLFVLSRRKKEVFILYSCGNVPFGMNSGLQGGDSVSSLPGILQRSLGGGALQEEGAPSQETLWAWAGGFVLSVWGKEYLYSTADCGASNSPYTIQRYQVSGNSTTVITSGPQEQCQKGPKPTAHKQLLFELPRRSR